MTAATSRLLKESLSRRKLTSAAEAAIESMAGIAALKRCATQNPIPRRVVQQPARERMLRERMIGIRVIRITALVLVISIGFLAPKAAAQSDKYSKMAPVDQYLMERNAEILLGADASPLALQIKGQIIF
jgi:hypothetical protein